MVGFSLHQRAGDTACLIPHLEGVRANLSAIARRKPEILPQQDDQQPAVCPRISRQMRAMAAKRTTPISKSTTWATMSNTTPFTANYQKHRKPELIRKAIFRSENLPYDAEKDEAPNACSRTPIDCHVGHRLRRNACQQKGHNYHLQLSFICCLPERYASG